MRTFRGQRAELWAVDASPDGRWLASGAKDGSVMLWDLTSSTNRPAAFRTLQSHGGRSWGYSPDGRLFGALQQGRLKVYDASTLELASEPPLPLNTVLSFAFSPDTRLLVGTDSQGHLAVWDLAQRQVVTNFAAHSSAAYLLDSVFMSGGKSLLTFDKKGMARQWDTTSWTEMRHWRMDPEVKASAISPTASLVATVNGRGTFELTTADSPGQRRHFTGQNRIGSIKLSPDGKALAAASENGTVELWDTDTLTRKAFLHGVLLGYHSIAFSPDGQRLAAGSNGQEAIKIWDLNSHEEVATLAGHGSLFTHAAFSPDGNTIGARNWNGVLHFWSAASWQQIQAAEKGAAPVSPSQR